MYILTIGRAYPEKKTGMIGIFELEQAKALAAAGNQVVYAFSDNRSMKILRSVRKVKKTEDGVSIYGRQLPIGGMPTAVFNKLKTHEFKKLMKTICAEQGVPDVVYVHFPLLTLTEELVDYIRGLGCKLVCIEHWTKVQIKQIAEFRKRLLAKCVEESHAFLCVSTLLKESVQQLTQTKKEIYVVPNMVPDAFFSVPKPVQETGIYCFASAGRLVPLKRFDMVLRAFAEAFAGDKNVRLQIAGSGEMYPRLQAMVSELQVADQVTLPGFLQRDEMQQLYAQSDCYVSASSLETFGVPFVEAWAMGIPCIGAKNSPIDSYYTPENGMLFDGNSVQALAEAMKAVYANRDRYNRKEISETAEKLFSSRNVAKRLLEIFAQ